jgi:hypothetical protein
MRINWVFSPQTFHFSEGKSGKVRIKSSEVTQSVVPEALADHSDGVRATADDLFAIRPAALASASSPLGYSRTIGD